MACSLLSLACLEMLVAISSRTLVSVSLKRRPDGGISILDDSLGIDWRIPTEHANLSEKDKIHEVLKDFESPFEY
jgi:hypothetical protein